MKQIDHIGVAVKDIESSERLFGAIMGVEPFHRETVESQHMKVSFLKLGSTKVELLHPTSEKSGVYNFLEKRGEGIHHVAFAVENIYKEVERMKSEGYQPLTEKPWVGALNKLVIFFHPKETGGVLIEFCQEQKIAPDDWDDYQEKGNPV